jgi:hypothetical protein
MGIGKARMITSMRRLDIAFPKKNDFALMQVPDWFLFQLKEIGRH